MVGVDLRGDHRPGERATADAGIDLIGTLPGGIICAQDDRVQLLVHGIDAGEVLFGNVTRSDFPVADSGSDLRRAHSPRLGHRCLLCSGVILTAAASTGAFGGVEESSP
jgi:hypothetical protein